MNFRLLIIAVIFPYTLMAQNINVSQLEKKIQKRDTLHFFLDSSKVKDGVYNLIGEDTSGREISNLIESGEAIENEGLKKKINQLADSTGIGKRLKVLGNEKDISLEGMGNMAEGKLLSNGDSLGSKVDSTRLGKLFSGVSPETVSSQESIENMVTQRGLDSLDRYQHKVLENIKEVRIGKKKVEDTKLGKMTKGLEINRNTTVEGLESQVTSKIDSLFKDNKLKQDYDKVIGLEDSLRRYSQTVENYGKKIESLEESVNHFRELPESKVLPEGSEGLDGLSEVMNPEDWPTTMPDYNLKAKEKLNKSSDESVNKVKEVTFEEKGIKFPSNMVMDLNVGIDWQNFEAFSLSPQVGFELGKQKNILVGAGVTMQYQNKNELMSLVAGLQLSVRVRMLKNLFLEAESVSLIPEVSYIVKENIETPEEFQHTFLLGAGYELRLIDPLSITLGFYYNTNQDIPEFSWDSPLLTRIGLNF